MPFPNCSSFIQFHDWLNCFAYVKNTLSDEVMPKVAPKNFSGPLLGYFLIRHAGNPNCFLYVQIFGSLPFTHVFVNRKLAVMAGFESNIEVILEQISPTICTSLEVVPLSQHDYELLNEYGGEVEKLFLQQIRLVHPTMKFPLWVSPTMCIEFRIGRAHPSADAVLLLPLTELHVLSVVPESESSSTKRLCEKNISIENAFSKVLGSISLHHTLPPLRFCEKLLRVIPSSLSNILVKDKLNDLFCPQLIYILAEETSRFAALGVMSMKTPMNLSPPDFVLVETVLRTQKLRNWPVIPLSKFPKAYSKKRSCVVINKPCLAYSTMSPRMLDVGQIVYAHSVDVFFSREDMEWIFSSSIQHDVYSALRKIVLAQPLLLTHMGVCLLLPVKGRELTIRLSPADVINSNKLLRMQCCCFVASATCTFIMKSEPTPSLPCAIPPCEPENYGFTTCDLLSHFDCQRKLVKELSHWAEYSWCHVEFGHALLLGSERSGKSSVAALLAQRLAQLHCCFSVRVDCSLWKGKSTKSIKERIISGINSLSKRSPSLLILDDFESFDHFSDDKLRQLGSDRIFQLLRRLMSKSAVPILVVAKYSKFIHQRFMDARGKRLFGLVRHLTPFSEVEKNLLLRGQLNSDYRSLTMAETAGCSSLSDVRHLATKIEVEAKIQEMSSPVTEGGLNQTLAFSHSTIHSNKCRDEGKPSLNDVGGMDVEKRTLLEVLVWPTKHKKVYESYGICSGRGILLHGPSGCGKTLLAKAVVAHSKINSIFVKGPELLSKFVGSSEGNVRKVFERARASAPCVIIFDEFDSIAPQRGSDSNGVTDRVVNQLLTEMDGVDNLSGVFVIGCSNRIDLIDSALLRPGRFDHILECSMPDKKNRREILRALLRSVSHDPAVSTDELAARTNGWSGADLKALIVNAQFDALRKCSVDHEKRSATIRSFNIENVFNDSSPKREPVKERTRVGNRVLLH